MNEALIWGASGGIGSALATLLKTHGWHVFGAARNENRIPPGMDRSYSFDAADPFSYDNVAMGVAQASSGLDLAVYAAGTMSASTAEAFDAVAWRQVMDANLNGAWLAAKASVNLLKEGGHFMVIGAHVDKISLPRFSAYAAAKAGLEPLVTILAKEQRKLKFTLVRPGAVDTPFWGNVPFKLPAGAASPAAIAEALLARYDSGQAGVLDV
jgi:NAD(P)-dependent dehydrogenase (short-subunit alcohol dehydrogenase family)